ncbi:hypothetical protein CH249_15445 [Rhodococcus sp. 05-2255-3B1]|uniref:hypothetical protein n=1 Tax=unclassified Rhodococcus (in: high G+C Gram-positive bacteria) TaxID=192944 RepID=UPI000B9B7E5F|nr:MULTISPECIES: hypothetical protein [unclassified Rhodococcus (in: high G+C Gram-positive bacteria)]OZE03183.1 hypothetical protein CH250_23510 [Rhodococcus sp. 05-2255-3C]OZE09572.1 hypothetical protein CH249_15445 [Rhodococcus sp. 05-2255-3B1]OZE14838.1 hypothetical protein CH255_21790 [Rhodococcus sp. 05-2255-2A2]
MTEFNGGCVPTGREIWTAFVGKPGEGCSEEIDVHVPRGSSDAHIRADVQAILDADYVPGLVIVGITEFTGAAIYTAGA